MITDEKRRERAKNLRDMISARNYGIPGTFGSFVDVDDLLSKLLDRRAYDSEKAINAVEALDIADLIDRPTCHLIEDEDGRPACSECGYAALYLSDVAYCPVCGSMIKHCA